MQEMDRIQIKYVRSNEEISRCLFDINWNESMEFVGVLVVAASWNESCVEALWRSITMKLEREERVPVSMWGRSSLDWNKSHASEFMNSRRTSLSGSPGFIPSSS